MRADTMSTTCSYTPGLLLCMLLCMLLLPLLVAETDTVVWQALRRLVYKVEQLAWCYHSALAVLAGQPGSSCEAAVWQQTCIPHRHLKAVRAMLHAISITKLCGQHIVVRQPDTTGFTPCLHCCCLFPLYHNTVNWCYAWPHARLYDSMLHDTIA